jgi:hypothetical protein
MFSLSANYFRKYAKETSQVMADSCNHKYKRTCLSSKDDNKNVDFGASNTGVANNVLLTATECRITETQTMPSDCEQLQNVGCTRNYSHFTA